MQSGQKILRWTLRSGMLVILILALVGVGPVFAQGPDGMPQVEIVPVDGNPVLPLGPADAWDGISIRFPYVLIHEGQYHMFYTAFTALAEPQAIGYAVSEDGVNWMRFEENPILVGSEIGFDSFGVNRAVVLVDDDGTWVMYYNGNPKPGTPPFGTGIGRATAPSPTGPWTRSSEPVLEVGPRGAWDRIFIFPDSVLKTDDGYVMYYSGNGTGTGMVGRATSSDGITWTKYDDPATTDAPFAESDPVLMPDSAQAWAQGMTWGGAVQQTAHGWEMFFTGGPGPSQEFALGYAYSADGLTWTQSPANPVVFVERQSQLFPSFVVDGDVYRVYYGLSPVGASKTEGGLAEGVVTFGE